MRSASFHRSGMKAIRPLSHARQAFVIAAVTMTAACVPPPRPLLAPIPVPAPVPRPRPIPLPAKPAADWRDTAPSPGEWRWALNGGRSAASYGLPGQTPSLALVCDQTGARVLIERSGDAAAAVPITLRTTSILRPLSSDPALGRPGIVATALPARDPLLDAMAFSRGRFAIEVAGLETLYLPAWPEVSRVIEDCR